MCANDESLRKEVESLLEHEAEAEGFMEKTAAQVAKWGGTQSAFDPCYHRVCDTNPSNISDTVLDRSGDASRVIGSMPSRCSHRVVRRGR